MNLQEYRNLQEAYLDVYDEDYKPWDFGPKQKAQAKFTDLAQKKAEGNSPSGTATRANAIASVAKDMRTTLDKNSAATGTNPAKQGLQPATQRHTAAALRGAGGGMTASKVYDVKPLKPTQTRRGGQSASSAGAGSASGTTGRDQYKVGGGEGYGVLGIKLANSYEPDLYDVILEYLLDEGYANTNESALVIMANMSEGWRESILTEAGEEALKKEFSYGKRKKIKPTDSLKLPSAGDASTRKGSRDYGDDRPSSTRGLPAAGYN
jgi:hypothetical protein